MSLIIVLLFFIILYLTICYVIYRMCFYCKSINTDEDCYRVPKAPQYLPIRERMFEYVSELQSRPFEQIFIKNRNNKTLAARVYKTTKGAPVDICFHGWKGNSIRDFCGGARLSIKMGHNLILVDQRGQGQSFGHTMTFGIKEKYDVQDWCNWAVENFPDSEINLFGVTMGAATVIMASNLNLPSQVKHIIADSPYSSAIKIIRKVCDVDMKLSSRLLYPFLVGSAFIFGHFRITDKKSTGDFSVKNSKIPVLIIHGDEDLFVPCAMSGTMETANPAIVKRIVFQGAGHGLSYMIDTERYEKSVIDFINNN